jgi:molybdopterin synthase catalytic subunit/molybdopterin converting factor small subunit
MSLLVRYFAVLRERAGLEQSEHPFVAGETVGSLYLRLFPDLADADGTRLPVMYAVNASYVTAEHPLADGDEVAFIPPLGGGSGDLRVAVTPDPLDADALQALVSGPQRGGICTFTGTVRDHFEGRAVQRLEYEAYEDMAVAQMGALCDEAEARWPGLKMAMHHRVGTLAIGEAAVIVCAAAAHRDAAFEACRWGIDTLKERVPIWKKEIYRDGASWKANAGSSPDHGPSDPGQPPVRE